MPGKPTAANTDIPPFWRSKTLAQMTKAEWESLCDGCAKCCLNKLENETTGEIQYTDVACRLLDTEECRCVSYDDRKRYVPDCRILTAKNIKSIEWLPSTCAYRLIDEGKDLFWWHPLVSGDADTVHQASVSVRGRVVSERDTDDLENRIVGWPK
ncbi:MAG: YcgN family cysteine cluster protein [Proteobacteria bacterium]|nr:YcgN family cysteine cluster protein [Pseudomonadota bacterium]